MRTKSINYLACLALVICNAGCAVVSVASATVSVASTVVGVGVGAAGAVVKGAVNLATPDSDEKK